MKWKDGKVDGVEIRPAQKREDKRGWLAEIFRSDEALPEHIPAMAYVSITHTGVSRGPHEHKRQTDVFCFFGPGSLRLIVWDNRPDSPTYGNKMTVVVGAENPCIVVVPPHIVHGYTNISDCDAMIINLPNALFAGEKRKDPVDEIRYENVENSPFVME